MNRLQNLFCTRKGEWEKVQAFLHSLLIGKSKSLLKKLGSGEALGNANLIPAELEILFALCKCEESKIIDGISDNKNVDIKHLNLLLSSNNVMISHAAREKLEEIFEIMKKFIIKGNLSIDDWGNRPLDNLSLATIEIEINRFQKRSDSFSREIDLFDAREKVGLNPNNERGWEKNHSAGEFQKQRRRDIILAKTKILQNMIKIVSAKVAGMLDSASMNEDTSILDGNKYKEAFERYTNLSEEKQILVGSLGT